MKSDQCSPAYPHGAPTKVSGVNSAQGVESQIIKYFNYEHLPAHLQEVSKSICVLAQMLDKQLPNSAEKSAGLRKLLEAKDCFIRAAIR